MIHKILCVDDDSSVLEGYQRSLRKQFAIEVALGAEAGLEAIRTRGPYAVVVADMQMPGMNGVEFLAQVRELAPGTVRFMLTGNADQATAVEAVNQGHVFQFLTKPCPAERFAEALHSGIAQFRLLASERELLENTLNGSVNLLGDVLSIWDPASFGLGQNLRELMRLLAHSWRGVDTWELELGALLSPIGYAAVPPTVLDKYRSGQALSSAELDIIRRAPELGANLIRNIPRLENVAQIVRYQEKHFDGSGFPADETKGRDIPVGARILKVLLDMLRLEAGGTPRMQALGHMRSQSGIYDPAVLDAAIARFEESSVADLEDASASVAVPLRALVVGNVLAERVETVDGLLIGSPGVRVTHVLLERLWNFKRSTGIREPIHIRT